MRSCASPTGSREHDFFVATKTGERTYAAAREQIRRSLDRLGVDHVDSIQLHNLVDVIEWDIALSPGGALEACIEARDEGLVRFIGVTGHGLSDPARCTCAASSASPSTPCCARTTTCRCRTSATRRRSTSWPRVCKERDVALQTIKSLAYRPWEGREHTAATWYEPLTEQADIDKAASWVLGNPQAFLLTTGDVDVLPKLLDAAERHLVRPSDEEMAALGADAAVHVVEQLAQRAQQRRAVERLLQERAARREAAALAHGVGGVARDEQRPQPGARAAEPARELGARHVGHDHVGDEPVDVAGLAGARARAPRSAAPR